METVKASLVSIVGEKAQMRKGNPTSNTNKGTDPLRRKECTATEIKIVEMAMNKLRGEE